MANTKSPAIRSKSVPPGSTKSPAKRRPASQASSPKAQASAPAAAGKRSSPITPAKRKAGLSPISPAKRKSPAAFERGEGSKSGGKRKGMALALALTLFEDSEGAIEIRKSRHVKFYSKPAEDRHDEFNKMKLRAERNIYVPAFAEYGVVEKIKSSGIFSSVSGTVRIW